MKTTGLRVLGLAFLFQFVTSFSSSVLLQPVWLVTGDVAATMTRIADNAGLMRANILLDMLTALGVIFLGAMLFLALRKQSEKMALTALAFYILEGAVLAASRADAFSLLRMSQEYVAAGQPAYLEMMATVALESMDFVGGTLHMLAFCFGAILFYYLLYKSAVVPRGLSLWGLITVLPCLAGTLLATFGYEAPFFIYLLYVPFEFVIGVWILVKGTNEVQKVQPSPVFAGEIR